MTPTPSRKDDQLNHWLSDGVALDGYTVVCVGPRSAGTNKRTFMAFPAGLPSTTPETASFNTSGGIGDEWMSFNMAVAGAAGIKSVVDVWEDAGGFFQRCENEHPYGDFIGIVTAGMANHQVDFQGRVEKLASLLRVVISELLL